MLVETLLSFTLGVIAGFIGGIAGVGGGSLMAPLLIIAGIEPHHAVAASLFAIMGTALGGITRLFRHGLVRIRAAIPLAVASTLGALMGSFIAVNLPGTIMLLIIVVALATSGLVTLREARLERLSGRHRRMLATLVMFAGGLASGMAGKGGGSFAVPTLIGILGLTAKEAVATSRLIVLSNAVLADAVYAAHGLLNPFIAVPLLAGTYLGSTLASHKITSMEAKRHRIVAASVYFSMAALAAAKLALH